MNAMRVKRVTRLAVAVLAVWAAAGLSGCRRVNGPPQKDPRVAIGDPARGRELIERYSCGSCHMVPGVDAARGLVGPPLIHWANRRYIAGEMENTPEHLVTWLTVPQSVEPGTAMPNMGVTDGQARAMAAYLYTLK